jgi:hypothetical protein
MLNINTKLLDLVQDKTITTDDFFILLAISKRINSDFKSFPSIQTLKIESRFGKNKIYSCLKNLEDSGLLKRKQRRLKNEKGNEVLSSNLYTITTDLVGVFINANNKDIEESNFPENGQPLSQNEDTENEYIQNETRSIIHNRSIKQNIEHSNNFLNLEIQDQPSFQFHEPKKSQTDTGSCAEHQNVSNENVEQQSLQEKIQKLSESCGLEPAIFSQRSDLIFPLLGKFNEDFDLFIKFMKEKAVPGSINIMKDVKTEKFWKETLRYYTNWKALEERKEEDEREWDHGMDYEKYFNREKEDRNLMFLETLIKTLEKQGNMEEAEKTKTLIKKLKSGEL